MSELKYITPMTSEIRNTAEEINKRYREIESKTETLEKSGGGVNLLDNGGFSIWQRGDVFNYAPNGIRYTSDRWRSLLNGIDKVEKIANTNSYSTSKYACRLYRGNNWNVFGQPLENFNDIIGKTITISVNIKANKSTTILMGIGDRTKVYNLTTNWQKIEMTTKPNNTTEAWRKAVFFGSTALNQDSGTVIEISDAKLELGEIATPFIPENETLELLKCQRYYERGMNVDAFADDTKVFISGINYKTEKRIIPTIAIGNIWVTATGQSVTNEGVAHEAYSDSEKISLIRSLNAAPIFNTNKMYMYYYLADAEIY